MGRLFADGRIARVPAKRKVRAAVLLEVVRRFEPGRVYSEPEVNDVLLEATRLPRRLRLTRLWHVRPRRGTLDP